MHTRDRSDSTQGGDGVFGCTRRHLLRGLAGTAGLLALGADRLLEAQVPTLPVPETSGLDHVVVVMMENRSFDHFLGWLPGADGKQAGLAYQDEFGVSHPTHALAPDYQGCGHPDPDHSYEGGRIEYAGGQCDGWLLAGENDEYAIGYYTRKDLSFLGKHARHWSSFDRYFSAIMAPTFPNRLYQHAAQTDRLTNDTTTPSTLPTIWDRLLAAGVSGRYYFSDVPFLALWGSTYLPIGRPFTAFLADCAAGTLPQVAFVDPRFLGADSGTSGDDHPHADIRNGETFLDTVYKAVTRGPAWSRTALVINYDEWGGFFDHVPPPVGPIPAADQVVGNDGLLGFRVPSLLVSPWSPRARVFHGTYDHTSVLSLIEWRWNLEPLTVRDAAANNLAEVLNFPAPDLEAPQFPVPQGPFGGVCMPTTATVAAPVADSWTALREIARSSGWAV